MPEPILRATTSTGVTWDDPSENLIFELLTDIEQGREEFVVIDRRGRHETYAQALLLEDGVWLMEYRAGSAEHHYAATTREKHVVHSAMAGWAFELDGWRELLGWRPADL